jgi:hypothetical protein
MSKNKNVVEVHGCIVCGRTFNILAIYTQDGRLVDCTVTSPGGHRVPDEQHPLVACDTHTAEEIKSAHKRWQAMKSKEPNHEQEE